ncbi:protocatechuate 3,4-dioxygenase subunit beta [Pseudaestuariivita sp.]|uniref:protocatechuate 3,4-dioxygenase subunit beta n=1 Tax=Pseudaestuariivita sp. TaxID=2211669 RepID=UPI0040593F1E
MSDDTTAQRVLYPRDFSVHPPALAPAYKSSVLRSPRQPLVVPPAGLGDTTSPAFGHGDIAPGDDDLLTNFATPGKTAIGERIVLTGRVTDQDAKPVPGVLVELWQANAGGRYRHARDGYLAALDPDFGGLGRCLTQADGTYAFRTIRPGPYPWPNGPNSWRPAHIHLSLFGTSFAQRLITQMYFEGDPLIALCPIVQSVPDPAAIDRLTARLDLDASLPMDALCYRLDLVLRGRRQTPFENRPEGA